MISAQGSLELCQSRDASYHYSQPQRLAPQGKLEGIIHIIYIYIYVFTEVTYRFYTMEYPGYLYIVACLEALMGLEFEELLGLVLGGLSAGSLRRPNNPPKQKIRPKWVYSTVSRFFSFWYVWTF